MAPNSHWFLRWFFTCKVKAKGQDITKIRVCEVRVKHNPNFGSALAYGLYVFCKSCLKIKHTCLENRMPAHGVED
jgi:hypothetical protein